jgi:hypothetical protein
MDGTRLRAPFRPRAGVDAQAVVGALRRACRTLPPFVLPPLRVERVGDFLALVPVHHTPELTALSSACMRALHPLALPPSQSDIARRLTAGLSDEQATMLARWGYPHVLDCFRFHVTLTGSLVHALPAQVEALRQAALACFHRLARPRCDAVALFAEPAAGANFRWVGSVRLGTGEPASPRA